MDSSSSCCVFSSLILNTKPFGDGAMDDGGRLRIELAASSSCSVCRRPLLDGRWVMGMEQNPSSAATRVTEQPFPGSTLLTTNGGGAEKRWPKHCLLHLSRVAYRSNWVMVVVVSTPSRAWARTGSQTPARGPHSFSPHTSSSAATPTGSVHKSQTVSVVGMSGQLKRCNESWFGSLQSGQFAAGWLAGSILCR